MGISKKKTQAAPARLQLGSGQDGTEHIPKVGSHKKIASMRDE